MNVGLCGTDCAVAACCLREGANRADPLSYFTMYQDMVAPMRGAAYDTAIRVSSIMAWQCGVNQVRIAAADLEVALPKINSADSVRDTFKSLDEATAAYVAIGVGSAGAAADADDAQKKQVAAQVAKQKQAALQKVKQCFSNNECGC